MQKHGLTPFSGSLMELAGGLVAAAAVLTLVFITVEHRATLLHPTRQATSSYDSASRTLDPADASFLQRAVRLQLEELILAERCVADANNLDVRAFAGQLITDYRMTVSSLESLARERGVQLPAHEESAAPGPVHAVAKADTVFLDQLVNAEAEAVDLFEQAALQCADGDLRTFARKTLAALQAHQAQAKRLRQTVS